MEALGDVLEASFEAERNSLEAFTSARTLAGKATKLEVLPEADAMHTLLESPGAHEFDGCTESSPEEAEYISLVEAIEAYKQRWCDGKIPAVRARCTC